MRTAPAVHARFDAAYYERFYRNPRTRVVTPEERARYMAVIVAVLKQQAIDVRSILDAGCGLGLARKPLLKAFPSATYTGLEVSEYLCAKYGWIQSSLVDFKTRERFDFVICSDVIQYFNNADAERAIERLARLTRGVLYFHTPTREDLADTVDEDFSDTNVHFRPAKWYRTRLANHFQHLGFGLYLSNKLEPELWELAKASPLR